MGDAIARGGNSDFHADAENPPDDLRTRIAAALKAHQRDEGEPSGYCDCGEIVFSDEMTAHQADAVIAGLGLVEERVINGKTMWRDGIDGYDTPYGRFVFAPPLPASGEAVRYVQNNWKWKADDE